MNEWVTWNDLDPDDQQALIDVRNGINVNPLWLAKRLRRLGLLEMWYKPNGDQVDALTDYGARVLAQRFDIAGLVPDPAAPEPAGDDMSEAAFDAVGVQRMIPGLWRITQENGITNMELVSEDSNELATLRAANARLRSALVLTYWRLDRVHGTFEVPLHFWKQPEADEMKHILLDWKADIAAEMGTEWLDKYPGNDAIDKRGENHAAFVAHKGNKNA